MSVELTKLKREVVTGLLPRLLYKIENGPDFDNKLEEVSQLLHRRPELSALYYFNHLASGDPLFPAYIANRVGIGERKILAPTSYSHTDPSKPENRKTLQYVKILESSGVEVIRIIQEYQVNNSEYGYSEEIVRNNRRNFLKRLIELGESKTPIIAAISPEGHRSDDGALGVGHEAGLKAFGKYFVPIIFVPLAIDYFKGFKRDGMNLNARVRLTLGDYYIQETKNDYPGIEYLMRNLAKIMPLERRGRYYQ